MKYLTATLLTGILIAGCGSDQPAPANLLDAPPADPAPAVFFEAETRLDFGDVEATLRMELLVPEEHIPEGSRVDELRTAFERLTAKTIDFNGPVPATLPLLLEVKTDTDFYKSPVALRGKLIREVAPGHREAIYAFNTLVDVPSFRRVEDPMEGAHPAAFMMDCLVGLSEVPESLLLYIEAEAVLTAYGTDPESVDVETVAGGVDNSGTLLSSVLRINFSPPVAPAPGSVSDAADNGASAEAAEGAPEAGAAEDSPDGAEPEESPEAENADTP